MEKRIGKYLYTTTGNYDYIEVENLNNGKKAFITTETKDDWWAIYYDKADPVKDGWEDGIGNILNSLLED